MTGESPNRPAQRMSRFSQAYRAAPGGSPHASFEDAATGVLSRADTLRGPERVSPQWQRFAAPEPYADVIEVEFETVPPLPLAPEAPQPPSESREEEAEAVVEIAFEAAEPAIEPIQPPPPDIEAIAAALAAEMDRTATQAPEPRPITLEEALRKNASERVAAAEDAQPEAVDVMAATPETLTAPELPAPMENSVPANLPSPPNPTRISLVDAHILPLARNAAHFARAKAGPALIKAGFWLAHNLRRKEIRRRYGKVVAMTHGLVLDRQLEQHFFIPSLKAQRFAPDVERGIFYEGPVPAAAFNWAMSAVPKDLREYAFVDFRAGLGRAMLLAAQRNFERIIGYEYAPASYDDLQMNIAQFPRSKMVCRDVQCFRGDRSGISIPDQPCVLYFANAWREEFMEGIMSYVGESYRHKPRRLFVILENADEKTVLPGGEIFVRVEPQQLAEKLKLRLFSPMDFQIYRTLV
jgi:hypothetical protein